jgi:hypothetical protein
MTASPLMARLKQSQQVARVPVPALSALSEEVYRLERQSDVESAESRAPFAVLLCEPAPAAQAVG